MNYSVEVIAKTVFERELTNLMLTQKDDDSTIIQYLRQRIQEIKEKYEQ